MRNVRERPAALLSARGALPRVHLASSKLRRIGRGGNNFCSILFTGTCGIILVYSVYCLITGKSIFSFLSNDLPKPYGPNPAAYKPDWRPRIEALRPLLTGGGSERVTGLKEDALDRCSEAESSCEDVIEPFDFGDPEDNLPVTPQIKEQVRARRRCGAMMLLCEVAAGLVKNAIAEEIASGDVEETTSLPFVSACSDLCWQSGTCNEELKRCDCLGNYAGKECQEIAMPSCKLSGSYKTPCVDGGASCSCLLECESFGLINMQLESAQTGHVCLDDRGYNESLGVSKADWLFKQPLMHMDTDRNGTERGEREEEDDTRMELEPTVPSECESDCSGVGVCHIGGDFCWCPGIYSGKFCGGVRPTRPFGCLNKCSGQGKCVDGVCHCHKGFFGIDCSIYPAKDDKFDMIHRKPYPADYASLDPTLAEEKAKKAAEGQPRPLIYVYELPVHMMAWLFQHRLAGRFNSTEFRWAEALVFYEAMLASEHRTVNAAEADFFFVPMFVSVIGWENLRVAEVINYISTHWPYWTRHHGADHIFFHSEEWGNCNLEPLGWRSDMLKNAIGLTPWTYQRNMFGGKIDPCFIRGQDIGVPLAYEPEVIQMSPHLHPGTGSSRETLAFWCEDGSYYTSYRPKEGFVGLAEHYREPGLHKFRSSFGVRQKIIATFENSAVNDGNMVKVQRLCPGNKFEEMRQSVFCLAPPGWGASTEWSTLSVLMGCIPVFFRTNESYAFGFEVVNWDDISVTVGMEDMDNLVDILQAIPKAEVERRQAAMQDVWPTFVWASAQWDPIEGLPQDDRVQYAPQLVKKGPFATVMRILRNRLSGRMGDEDEMMEEEDNHQEAQVEKEEERGGATEGGEAEEGGGRRRL